MNEKSEKKGIYEFLIDPKVVKISTIIAFSVVFSCLIIGYIIAQFGPTGYNMVDNLISDMGSIVYTPFPYMRTISSLIAGPFFMPITFYIKERLVPKGNSDLPKKMRRNGNVGFVFMLVLFVGMMVTGIIIEDVNLLVHNVIAAFLVLGTVISTISYGLLIMKFPTDIHKNVGIYMILCMPVIGILAVIGIPSLIFNEWIFLFAVYAWIIICSVILLKERL